MYRKSVDYGQQSTIQISQFSVFKKKIGEQTPEIIIDNKDQYQFRIRKSNNSILLTVMAVDLMLQNSNKSKARKATSTHSVGTANTGKFFKDFIIENVPKVHYNYQHEGTLQQLLTSIYGKVKDQNLKQSQDMITNFTVTEFVLNCYARKLIKNYIVNSNHLDLLGNEEELLNDYNSQIRGLLLQALVVSCRLSLIIFYKDAAGHLEDTYKQQYGEKGSTNRIQMHDSGEYYKVILKLQNQEIKLTSVNSSQNIFQLDAKNKKQSESLNSTVEQSVQSRSANKETRCNRCSGKASCECEKTPKRIVVTRQISNNVNGTGPKSLFDSVGLGNAPKRQISIHDGNPIKR